MRIAVYCGHGCGMRIANKLLFSRSHSVCVPHRTSAISIQCHLAIQCHSSILPNLALQTCPHVWEARKWHIAHCGAIFERRNMRHLKIMHRIYALANYGMRLQLFSSFSLILWCNIVFSYIFGSILREH